MRLSFTLMCGFIALVQAVPLAIPTGSEFELVTEIKQIFQERFHPEDLEDFDNVIHKRDTELTIETLLEIFNRSGVLFDVLDLVAYSPSRIETIANFTAKTIGNVNTSSSGLSFTSFSSISSALNYTRIYNTVMDSGVVTSLLDGILLDDTFQPTLVKLVSRILEGNKNMLLYLVQDIFKKLKRDLRKRATSSLESFVGNIIALALNSDLVSGISDDVLTALNNTQFLTYTVKKFIANEGYQNMTAQLAIDIIRTGDLKINAQTINITKIADKALSNPTIIVGVVSQLLLGNINLSGLGKYSEAITAIVKKVEDNGVFEDLNKFVFSETHTVSKPLIATNDIVVAKATTARTTDGRSSPRSNSTTRSISTTVSNKTTSTTNPRTTRLSRLSTDSLDSESAAEVASILSLLGATTTFRSISDSSSSSEDALNISHLLDLLYASVTGDEITDTQTDVVSEESTNATGDAGDILSILAALGETQNREVAQVSSTSTSTSTSSNMGLRNNGITKVLIYLQILLAGGVLFL